MVVGDAPACIVVVGMVVVIVGMIGADVVVVVVWMVVGVGAGIVVGVVVGMKLMPAVPIRYYRWVIHVPFQLIVIALSHVQNALLGPLLVFFAFGALTVSISCLVWSIVVLLVLTVAHVFLRMMVMVMI